MLFFSGCSGPSKGVKLSDKEILVAGPVEVPVSGTFKTEHVFEASGGRLGALVIKGGKGEGVFTGDEGISLEFKKPSVWKNQYELHESKSLIASVQLPKIIRKAFDIEFAGRVFELSPGGSKNRSWTLRDDHGTEVCEILPRGGLKRGAKLEIASQIPLRLMVLVYYLVEKRWKEEAAASADL